MDITILSPDKEIYQGEAKVLTLPGLDGLFQILNNHAPLVAALGDGVVNVQKNDGESFDLTIGKGFVEVLDNQVSLLVTGVVEA